MVKFWILITFISFETLHSCRQVNSRRKRVSGTMITTIPTKNILLFIIYSPFLYKCVIFCLQVQIFLLISIILQFYQVPCSFVQFPVLGYIFLKNDRGSCRRLNVFRAAHRGHSCDCQEFTLNVRLNFRALREKTLPWALLSF